MIALNSQKFSQSRFFPSSEKGKKEGTFRNENRKEQIQKTNTTNGAGTKQEEEERLEVLTVDGGKDHGLKEEQAKLPIERYQPNTKWKWNTEKLYFCAKYPTPDGQMEAHRRGAEINRLTPSKCYIGT